MSFPRHYLVRYAALCELVLTATLLSGCACWPTARSSERANRFDFALIGDVPYNAYDATNSLPNMIAEINRAKVAFVVHDGDIKSGSAPCTDELFAERFDQFQTFQHPLIYIFGDNEWTDCARSKTNGMNPEERLGKLREVFTQGNQTLGRRKFPLVRQSDDPAFAPFRENVRWVFGSVVFAGLNIPGSGNNYGQPEFAVRNRANLAWLKETFAEATRDKRRGVMIIIQANPLFDIAATNKTRAGFNDFLTTLERETVAFQKPVVLVHGDTHYFRIDKPMMGSASKRRVENFTRVETFGNPDVHWLRATVDWRDPNLFSFRQQIVKKNLIQHVK